MNAIYDFFATVMSYILSPFVTLCQGNYTVAIFLFTFLINLVFLPVNFKQQRTSAKQARLRYKMEKLKKEYGDDRAKFAEEQQKLMQESGASMTAGCLPMFIRLPFFVGIYTAIRSPLTHIVKLSAETLTAAAKTLGKIGVTAPAGYEESAIIGNWEKLKAAGVSGLDKISEYNFDFFGIDLTKTPKFSFDFASVELALWIIPLLSFATSLLSMFVTTKMQKHNNPEMNANMGCMLIFMPLFSLWIAFSVPGAVGFYWACSNLVTMIIQIGMQLWYTPGAINAKEEAKEMIKRREYEQTKMKEAVADASDNS